MRIRYTFPFKRALLIEDHWTIPLQGGTCRIVSEGNRAKALEVTFTGQPASLAPRIEDHGDGPVKATITGRDAHLSLVRAQLDRALAYLECYFNLDLATEEVDIKYEAETPEEEAKIDVGGFSMGKNERPLPLTFDYITRALMVAETGDAPRFESSLASAARTAIFQQQYIDSFRYSFLLIEALFGGGKFKSAGLKDALKADQSFRAAVDAALKDPSNPRKGHASDTLTLMLRSPTTEAVIEHLVDKRGFYFHGNVKRKDSWKPDAQGDAEALALLAIDIVQAITHEAAAPMFAPPFAQRHFEDAQKAGATIVYNIKFEFREPEEGFDREQEINIRSPGTKVTGKNALNVAQEFLRLFEYNRPVASLKRAECRVEGTQERVFEISLLPPGN